MIGGDNINNICRGTKAQFQTNIVVIDFETENNLNTFMKPFMYSISVFIVLPLKKNNEYIYYNINSCEF